MQRAFGSGYLLLVSQVSSAPAFSPPSWSNLHSSYSLPKSKVKHFKLLYLPSSVYRHTSSYWASQVLRVFFFLIEGQPLHQEEEYDSLYCDPHSLTAVCNPAAVSLRQARIPFPVTTPSSEVTYPRAPSVTAYLIRLPRSRGLDSIFVCDRESKPISLTHALGIRFYCP